MVLCWVVSMMSWWLGSSSWSKPHQFPVALNNHLVHRSAGNIEWSMISSDERARLKSSNNNNSSAHLILGTSNKSQNMYVLRPNHLTPFDIMLLGQWCHHQTSKCIVSIAGTLKLIQKRNVQVFKIEFTWKQRKF